MTPSTPLRLAIAGVGNCASSLVQGIEFYRHHPIDQTTGIMHQDIGGYRPQDIQVVAAFDIDSRKVGRPLEEAVFAAPKLHHHLPPGTPRLGRHGPDGPGARWHRLPHEGLP